MTSQQAKEILVVYRPGLDEATEPELAEALRLASTDRELKAWFENQKLVQGALRRSFAEIRVPDGLREQILSERPTSVWSAQLKRRAIFASAGAAVFAACLLLVLLRWQPGPEKNFEIFRTRMAGVVLRDYPKMDLESSDLERLRTFLRGKHAPADYRLSPALARTSGTGCKVLDWNGHAVSMVCMNSRGATGGDPDLFLFVTDESAAPKNAPEQIRFNQNGRLMTASWTKDGQAYVLAGFGDENFLKKYL